MALTYTIKARASQGVSVVLPKHENPAVLIPSLSLLLGFQNPNPILLINELLLYAISRRFKSRYALYYLFPL